MDCAEEVAVLKREVGRVVGGEGRLTFNLLERRMDIAPGDGAVSPGAVLEAISRAGMRAEVLGSDVRPAVEEGFWERRGRVLLTAASGSFALAGFLLHVFKAGGFSAALGSEGLGQAHQVPPTSQALYAAGVLAGAWFVLPKAWLAARRLRPDMNLLMTVAVLGAMGIGEWLEAATVSFLFAVSFVLESWSVGRARHAVATLLDLTPPRVRLQREDGTEKEVPLEEALIGSLFVVKPGEKVPLDGEVVSGASEVNQAPLTGESLPIAKKPGDQVLAGTINGDGALEVRCTHAAGETTLARVVRLVAEAQVQRAPSERWVERFARVYTPAIMGLAVLVLVVPPLFLGGSWTEWFYRSLVLLVIGCPCALVISTPVSIVAALAASARNGVLVKGGVYIEEPSRLVAIALDKTGTLTEGKLAVVDLVPLNGHDEAALLERAAAIEARSEHPIARAIAESARKRGISAAPAEEFTVVQGKGATALVRGRKFWLGSHRYLEERGQETPEVHARVEALSAEGKTIVALGNEDHVCGLIALADDVRPEAKAVIDALRAEGLRCVVMLTGDHRMTAEVIARKTGVDEVHADLLPADKVAVMESLVSRFGKVAMVGDGVNDAPALARATVGIAMGAEGTDVAIETADIALMSDDLSKLPWLVRHSRRTVGIIRENITAALSVKALFVALTFLGYASLWSAIAADMGTSLLVTFNGLRLLRVSRIREKPHSAVIRSACS